MFTENNKPFIKIISSKKIIKREVKLGFIGEEYIEVINGISVGDTVLVPYD